MKLFIMQFSPASHHLLSFPESPSIVLLPLTVNYEMGN